MPNTDSPYLAAIAPEHTLSDENVLNERRADRAEVILREHSDNNATTDGVDGVVLDMSDAVANFIHLCARTGLDWGTVLNKAEYAYEGDHETTPPVVRDTVRWPEA